MTNEATKVELYGANNDGQPRSYIAASSASFSKGQMLVLGDGRVVTAHSAQAEPIAGVASMEKSGKDYSTTVSAWTDCVLDMVAWGTIVAGEPLTSASVANTVRTSTIASGAAIVIGYALDSVASGARVNVRVQL